MALANLQELKDAVQDYLTDDDVSGRLDTFIALAEVRFQTELKLRGMYKSLTGTFSNRFVTIPTDYVEMEAFRVTDPIPPTVLRYAPPDVFWDGARANYRGRPVMYTVQGDNFVVQPEPLEPNPGEQGYGYQIDYFAGAPRLSPTNDTNWLLTKWPNLYLYGTLMEAQPYLVDDEGLPRWQAMYERAANMAMAADSRGRFRPSSRVEPNAGFAYDGAFRIIRGSGV